MPCPRSWPSCARAFEPSWTSGSFRARTRSSARTSRASAISCASSRARPRPSGCSRRTSRASSAGSAWASWACASCSARWAARPSAPRVFNCDAPDQGNMDLLLQHASAERAPALARAALRGRDHERLLHDRARARRRRRPVEPAHARRARRRRLSHRRAQVVLDGRRARRRSSSSWRARATIPKSGATIFVVDRHAAGVDARPRHRDHAPSRSSRTARPSCASRACACRAGGARGRGRGLSLARRASCPRGSRTACAGSGSPIARCICAASYRDDPAELRQHSWRNTSSCRRSSRDNAFAIHAGNLMTFHCAWMLERGLSKEARVLLVHGEERTSRRLLCQVLDDAIQLHGALGYQPGLPFGGWYAPRPRRADRRRSRRGARVVRRARVPLGQARALGLGGDPWPFASRSRGP